MSDNPFEKAFAGMGETYRDSVLDITEKMLDDNNIMYSLEAGELPRYSGARIDEQVENLVDRDFKLGGAL